MLLSHADVPSVGISQNPAGCAWVLRTGSGSFLPEIGVCGHGVCVQRGI